MKSLGYFSNKGGVGKTTVAYNVAIHLANEGKSVCLLDLDFYWPGLTRSLELETNKWINDYFLNNKPLIECLTDANNRLSNTKGKLWIGLARTQEDEVLQERSFGLKSLEKLIQLQKKLEISPFKVEYLITDNSPGLLNVLSLNSFLLMDEVYFIIRIDNSDIFKNFEGQKKKYNLFKKQIANKIENAILHFKISEKIDFNLNREALPEVDQDELEKYMLEISKLDLAKELHLKNNER